MVSGIWHWAQHVPRIRWQLAFPKPTKQAALPHGQDILVCAAGCCRCLWKRCLSKRCAAGGNFLDKCWDILVKSTRHALPHTPSLCCPRPLCWGTTSPASADVLDRHRTFLQELVCEELSPCWGHGECPSHALDPARTFHYFLQPGLQISPSLQPFKDLYSLTFSLQHTVGV